MTRLKVGEFYTDVTPDYSLGGYELRLLATRKAVPDRNAGQAFTQVVLSRQAVPRDLRPLDSEKRATSSGDLRLWEDKHPIPRKFVGHPWADAPHCWRCGRMEADSLHIGEC